MDMLTRRGILLALGSSLGMVSGALEARADQIVTAAGQRLARRLAAFGVETRWIAGQRVDWETGEPNGRPTRAGSKHTHCSAFVASAAKQMGIYILRPPQHSPVLLANAQVDWLASEGAAAGWQRLDGPVSAQQRANLGDLVVVGYRSRFDNHPGHIAIVYPAAKSEAGILAEGPQVSQAGRVNATSIAMKEGFAGHSPAWGRQQAVYFVHSLQLKDDAGPT